MSRERTRSDVAAEAAQRLGQIVEAAERAAQQVIDDAEAQARGILTEAQAQADRVVAGRLAEADLSLETLIARSEAIRAEAEALSASLEQARAILGAGPTAAGTAAPGRGHLSAVPEGQAAPLLSLSPGEERGPIAVPFGGPETETPLEGGEHGGDGVPQQGAERSPAEPSGTAGGSDGERRRAGRPFSIPRDPTPEFGPPSPNGSAERPRPAYPGAPGAPAGVEPSPLTPGESFRGSPAAERANTPAGARLLATQLAVSGSSREEIATRLRNGFEIEDTDSILDAILGPED